MREYFRYPWEKHFPAVHLHAPELKIKRHDLYAAAKSGETNAAYRLVADTVSDQVIEELARRYQRTVPTLASAHAIERTGINAIPAAMAQVLGSRLGWKVEEGIVQANIVGHTGADGFTRLARQAEFSGAVVAGHRYFLVDDFVGQGGTLANLRGWIIHQGGEVVGATALTGKPYSANLKIDSELLEELKATHGEELEHWWVDRFGFDFTCLTQSEGRYLRNTPTVERIRDRIVAALEG